MGLGEALLALWMALAPGQAEATQPKITPPEAGMVTITKTVAEQISTDSNRDFAATERPWQAEGGLPSWCKIGIMEGKAWRSRDTGDVIAQSSSDMFLLAHELGHCLDSRPFELVADQKTRREAFADAFAACVMVKAGRRSDLDLIAQARQTELGDNLGRRMRKAIMKAVSRPECKESKSSMEDTRDAWTVAAYADVEVFGQRGSSAGPPPRKTETLARH